MKPPATALMVLEAVVGSQAYGLATPSSDTDKLGVFAHPTSDFWLLSPPNETYDGIEAGVGDYCYHEAGKFVRLALKTNPTLIELLYMDEYTVMTDFGRVLIEKRDDFLSQGYVRNAYLGYMRQQRDRIHRRDTHPEGSKSAKNARHLFRLAEQGTSLWMYGSLDVRLTSYEAEQCMDFGESVAGGNLDYLDSKIRWAENIFDKFDTPLPHQPNSASIETWLVNLRSRMLVPTMSLNIT